MDRYLRNILPITQANQHLFIGYFAIRPWWTISLLFWGKCSYGNAPMDHGIISLFLSKSEFDIVFTSQIVILGVYPISSVSYSIIIHVHHV